MFQNYFRTAWRNLVRHKVNTDINVLGLTLGITVCVIIFLLVRFELSYDTFRADKDRIYRVVAHNIRFDGKKTDVGYSTSPLPDAMRRELSALATVAGFDDLYANVIVAHEDGSRQVFEAAKAGEEATPIGIVQPQYFDVFHYRWLAGNATTALNEPFRVVLSVKEATRCFGPRENPDQWDAWGGVRTVVKLDKGVSPAQVERQLPAFVKRHLTERPGASTAFALQPLSDVHFNEAYHDEIIGKVNRPTMYGLAAIAGFILLIAAINFIKLSTAQSVQRARDCAADGEWTGYPGGDGRSGGQFAFRIKLYRYVSKLL